MFQLGQCIKRMEELEFSVWGLSQLGRPDTARTLSF